MFVVDDSLIRALLFKRGLTVTEFARRAEINGWTARKLVKEGAKTNGRIVAKLAKFFGVEGEALLKKEAN